MAPAPTSAGPVAHRAPPKQVTLALSAATAAPGPDVPAPGPRTAWGRARTRPKRTTAPLRRRPGQPRLRKKQRPPRPQNGPAHRRERAQAIPATATVKDPSPAIGLLVQQLDTLGPAETPPSSAPPTTAAASATNPTTRSAAPRDRSGHTASPSRPSCADLPSRLPPLRSLVVGCDILPAWPTSPARRSGARVGMAGPTLRLRPRARPRRKKTASPPRTRSAPPTCRNSSSRLESGPDLFPQTPTPTPRPGATTPPTSPIKATAATPKPPATMHRRPARRKTAKPGRNHEPPSLRLRARSAAHPPTLHRLPRLRDARRMRRTVRPPFRVGAGPEIGGDPHNPGRRAARRPVRRGNGRSGRSYSY